MPNTILKISHISKSYGNKLALNDFSMEINEKEIVAIIGKNGAGKTTLLNSICRYIYPDKGEILYKGENISKCPSLLKEFGILMEPSFFEYMSAQENLELLLNASGKIEKEENNEIIYKLLKQVGLYEYRKKKVKSYSFGMKQRLGLCQSLLTKVGLLLLDEPFVGLDPIGKEIFKEIIRTMANEEGVPVLFSSHDLEDVSEICDRIIMIEDGQKVFDDFSKKEKIYEVQVQEKIPDKVKKILENRFPKIEKITDYTIVFSDNCYIASLQKILSEQQVYIEDVRVNENMLYQLFHQKVNMK